MHKLLAMNGIKRSGLTILRSSLRASSNADVGFAGFSSLATEKSVTTGDFFKRSRDGHSFIHHSAFQLATSSGQNMRSCCLIRCFASNTTELNKQKESENFVFAFGIQDLALKWPIIGYMITLHSFCLFYAKKQTRKDKSLDEDPFDYKQAASDFADLVCLRIVPLAAVVALFASTEYQDFNESNVYKVFSKSVDRVQNDNQIRVRIGSPIMGYVSRFPITGDRSELKNILSYRCIRNRTWIEDGTEHIVVNFHVHGPNGDGLAMSMMFKDKVDKQWKFKYLIVELESPARAQIVLEEPEGIRLIRTV